MLDVLQALRSVFELEFSMLGRYAPLGKPVAFQPETVSPDHSTDHTGRAGTRDSEKIEVEMSPVDLFGNVEQSPDDQSLSPYERIEALIPPDSPLSGMQTLEEVRDYVANTVLIPLDKTRTNPVFGVGHPNANLMVIGEAPGRDEDLQGEPFVGRAGQLLNKILEAVHFNRNEVYISNILKSRPPNNRDPLPEEVSAHIPILYKQIVLIKPVILLCVGRIAGNALLNRSSALAALRNKILDFHGLPVVVTYHPAALLRNEQWKRPTWEDVQLLRSRYDQIVGS